MKAIGYTRVSSEEQARKGLSLSAQKARIQKWAELHDIELISIFTDAGISGSRLNGRDGLKRALDRVCTDKCTLVVYSLSRLSRSTRDTLAIAEKISKAGQI